MTSAPARRWILVGTVGLVALLALLLDVVATSGGIDRRAARWAAGPRDPDLAALARTSAMLGSSSSVVGATVAVAVVLWLRTRTLLLAGLLSSAVGTTAGTVFLLQLAVGRSRSSVAVGTAAPVQELSFPSGHTADGSVAFWLGAALLGLTIRRRAARAAVLGVGGSIGVVVGLTRFYLGLSRASEVAAGWSLAMFVTSVGALLALQLSVSGATRPRPEPTPEEDTAVARVLFDLEPHRLWPSVAGEQCRAARVGADQYRIDHPPWFVRGVGVGDIVRAVVVDDQEHPVFVELLQASDHVTIRLVHAPDTPLRDEVDRAVAQLRALGVRAEEAPHYGVVALDVGPSLPIAAVKALVLHGSAEGWWHHEEARTTPEWDAAAPG